MFERILLAVDTSSHSGVAVAAARAAALAAGGEVRVLHIRDIEVFGRGATVASDAEGEAQQFADGIVADLTADGITATGIVHSAFAGRVAVAILEEAAAWDATLIVMGSKGLTDLEGILVGSTAHKVLHLSKLPVLVAR